MARKYDIELLQQIKEQEYKSTLFDIDVLIKPVPDSDLDGVIDPRLFKSSKKTALKLKYMPKPFLKIDMTSSKGVKVLRKMFNRVNSCQVVESGVEIQDVKVRVEDGYQIPLKIYRKSHH